MNHEVTSSSLLQKRFYGFKNKQINLRQSPRVEGQTIPIQLTLCLGVSTLYPIFFSLLSLWKRTRDTQQGSWRGDSSGNSLQCLEVEVGQPGQGASRTPGLPCRHPNIRSHPERKPGGRAPPKEACQVSETIKRQGKHPGSEEEGGRRGRKRGRYQGSWASSIRCGRGLHTLTRHWQLTFIRSTVNLF